MRPLNCSSRSDLELTNKPDVWNLSGPVTKLAIGPYDHALRARRGILPGRDPAAARKTKLEQAVDFIFEVRHDEIDLYVVFGMRKCIAVCSESDERVLSLKRHGQGIDTPPDIDIIRQTVRGNLL